MKVRNSRIAAVCAAFLALALLTAGCGGGGASEGSNGTVIKIGIGAPLTQGTTKIGQGIKRGALLAIAQMNESQEAQDLGITFEGVDGDDQGDPKTGVTVANTFASSPNLLGVVGHYNSGVSIPASKVYFENNIVQITPGSTNPALTQQGFASVFRTCTIDSVQGPAGADAAYTTLGLKTVVVVDDSTPYGEGLAAAFAGRYQELGGTVLFTEKSSDKDTDFNALVTRITQADPDFIFYGGLYNSGALLAKQASDTGFAGPTMGGDGIFDPEWIKLEGAQSAEGDLATCVGLPVDMLPKAQDFQTAYQEMFPNDEIAAFDAYAYDAANVIMKAILKVAKEQGVTKLQTPDARKAIIAAVAATNAEGVTGAISFDKNGDTTNKAITTYRVEGGVWVPKVVPGQ